MIIILRPISFSPLSPYGQNLKVPYYQVLIYFGNHSLILKEKETFIFKQNAILSETKKKISKCHLQTTTKPRQNNIHAFRLV